MQQHKFFLKSVVDAAVYKRLPQSNLRRWLSTSQTSEKGPKSTTNVTASNFLHNFALFVNKAKSATLSVQKRLVSHAVDAPVFRLQGNRHKGCTYGAFHRQNNENKTAGALLYAAVLGVFLTTLIATPVWFIFFYKAQKSKYEKLSYIEQYGDEG